MNRTIATIFFSLIALGLFVFEPTVYQYILIDLLWRNVFVVVLLIIGIIGWLLLVKSDSNSIKATAGSNSVLAICIVFLLMYLGFRDQMIKNYLVNNQNFTQITTFPEVQSLRLPYEVAVKALNDTYQSSDYSFGDVEPLNDPTLGTVWITAHTPRGFFPWFTGTSDGATIINRRQEVSDLEQEMVLPEGLFPWNSIDWRLQFRCFHCDIDEVYILLLDDELVRVAPVIKYRFQFPVFTPYWGGVYVVKPNGTTTFLLPEAAAELLDGHVIYPLSLATKIGEAFYYRHNLWPDLLGREDITEIPQIPDAENQMPYVLGDTIFLGLDPAGTGNGLFKQLYITGDTGEIKLLELDNRTNFNGPEAALSKMRRIPNYLYKVGENTGDTILMEPIPLIRQTDSNVWEYWWMGTAVGLDHRTIKFFALAHPTTGEVRKFNNYGQVERFLVGTFDGEVFTTNDDVGTTIPISVDPVVEVESGQPITDVTTFNVSDLTEQELLELDRKILEERQRRLEE